jgi:hypothetical protein
MRLFLILFLILLQPAAPGAEYQTIDELVRAAGSESCTSCHATIHEEWQSSYHAHSVVNSLTVLREFIVNGLGRDWQKPVSKRELMRCMECHAPQLADASETLAREVAQLTLIATDDKDVAGKEAARKTLDRLNVNCVVCHNTKAGVERNLKGPPQPGVYYGPTGAPSPAHGTARSTAITSAVFCGQCHGIYTAPDREIVFCTSLYESYQDRYRADGGMKSCQECHMRANNRGHHITGRHDVNMVRDGIAFTADVAGFRQYPGKWLPSVVVSANLTNRAGHRIPDG